MHQGESTILQLRITPLSAADPNLHVFIYARKEIYRQFTLQLTATSGAPLPKATIHAEAVTIRNDLAHCPSGHLNLRTTHEWTTPPGELNVSVFSGTGIAHAKGDVGLNSINEVTQWYGQADQVSGPITNVRASAERFRAKWGSYLNDIDPDDLLVKLRIPALYSDWANLYDRGVVSVSHQNAWEGSTGARNSGTWRLMGTACMRPSSPQAASCGNGARVSSRGIA